MTKEEFQTTDEALVMIVSINPDTGKVIFDTYDWKLQEVWMGGFKKDFPDMMHFSKLNPAAILERKRAFGLIV